jgi:hypothetical protein
MAIVDLATGNITGCEEGSRVWWHEKGHIAFSKLDSGAKINYYQYHFMMMAVFFMSVSLLIDSLWLKVFTFLNALGMVLSYIYEEVWCWAYSFRHYK